MQNKSYVPVFHIIQWLGGFNAAWRQNYAWFKLCCQGLPSLHVYVIHSAPERAITALKKAEILLSFDSDFTWVQAVQQPNAKKFRHVDLARAITLVDLSFEKDYEEGVAFTSDFICT